jgi:hypothetical protein
MTLERSAEVDFLQRPWIGALLLSWSVGVVDSYGYAKHGVFTTNQAGNLVVLAHSEGRFADESLLAVLSIVGAIVGVVLAVFMQKLTHNKYWLRIAVPTLVGVTTLAVFSIVALFVRVPGVVVIPLVSTSMAMIATGIVAAPIISSWITGNTGTLLTSAAGVAQGGFRWRHLPGKVQSALAITAGFILGAFSYAAFLNDFNYGLLVGILPTLIVSVLALIAHRQRRAPLTSQQ